MSDDAARAAEDRQIRTLVRWLLILIFVVIGYLVLRRLAPVLTPLVAAGGIAYLLDGAVDALVARRVPRGAAVGLLLGGFLLALGAIVVIAVPIMIRELGEFAIALPGMVERGAAWLHDSFGVTVPADWQATLAGDEAQEVLKGAAAPLGAFAAAAASGLLGVLGFVAELLLVPVFAFYFLVDWDHLVARAHRLLPPRHRGSVGEIVGEIDAAVSVWIRGTFTVMAVLAILYAVAFSIIGLHLGLLVGVAVGLLTIIPFLGTVVGAGLAGLMLALDWQGPGQLVAVALVFVALHLLEAAVLTPRLVGKKVGLGEVGALLAVLAGGELLGFTGVLLAVPIAAAVAVLVRRAHRAYEQSGFFTDGAPAAEAAALAGAVALVETMDQENVTVKESPPPPRGPARDPVVGGPRKKPRKKR